MEELLASISFYLEIESRLSDSFMRRILKHILTKAILVFCFIGAAEPQEDIILSFPIDVSVYDGQGSLLISWSYPDSIVAQDIKVFVQKFGQPEFELLSVLTSNHSNYLDTNCEPNERYFYKIEVEDIFGKIFNSDTQRPSFGTCAAMEDSLTFDEKIQSVFDLVQLHIQDEFKAVDSYTNFQPIKQLLKSNIGMNHNWFKQFPLELLKPSASSVEAIDDIIQNEKLFNSIMEYESIYRNHLFLSPDAWLKSVEEAILKIRKDWNLLYAEYPTAVEMFDSIAPIRIVGCEQNGQSETVLKLYFFHPEQLSANELYLLSGEEYIDLGEFRESNDYLITVPVPSHWAYVDLMMDDIFIQTCPLIINESVIYSIHGDIIPMDTDTANLIKVARNESSIWLNELTWNPLSKTLRLEVAGKPDYEDQYFIVNQNEPLWDIESEVGFEIQFIDSSFVLRDDLDLPTVISLKLSGGDELTTLEHIVLDTLPFAISRIPDGDTWHYTESITLGSTNEPIEDYYVADLVPEFFVLYQNYPNPFNGQTRITFDLLEDAAVTLYITDATGRIHDKLIEEEFIISGTYNYMWDGEGRSTGIYFITLQAQVDQIPPAVLSRKMIYLK